MLDLDTIECVAGLMWFRFESLGLRRQHRLLTLSLVAPVFGEYVAIVVVRYQQKMALTILKRESHFDQSIGRVCGRRDGRHRGLVVAHGPFNGRFSAHGADLSRQTRGAALNHFSDSIHP